MKGTLPVFAPTSTLRSHAIMTPTALQDAPYGLVVFDLDGTLLDHPEPIWKTLHERFGSDPDRRRRAMTRALSGEISYGEWFAEDVAMLQAVGVTRAMVEEVGREIQPTPGARELIGELRERGVFVAILSGGLDVIRQVALPDLTVDRESINSLVFHEDGTIAGGVPTAYDRDGKARGIREMADALGLSLTRVAFVGDGANDVEAARIVGCSVAWGAAEPRLMEVSTHRCLGPSMDDLRPILLGDSVP